MKIRPAVHRRPFGVAAALLVFLAFSAVPGFARTGFVSGLKTYPLRDTPEFSAPPIARLPVGTGLKILEERDGWISVQAGEKTGWMPDSVVGESEPAVVQLEPLQERAREAEARVGRLSRENDGFRERNIDLTERVAALETELAEMRGLASGARNSRRLQGMALGGGLVLFGWVTGYLLASRTGQARSKGKLIID